MSKVCECVFVKERESKCERERNLEEIVGQRNVARTQTYTHTRTHTLTHTRARTHLHAREHATEIDRGVCTSSTTLMIVPTKAPICPFDNGGTSPHLASKEKAF